MSKQIDPTNLSKDDVEYIRQRPWLRAEFVMNGHDDPLEDDEAPKSPVKVVYSNSSLDQPDGEESSTEYDSLKKKDLLAEINSRNEDRDEDEQIDPASERNADLIAALVADDQNATADA